ncbi:MAG: flavin reductase family protein [Clostridia bacterium]|nr:flavin reductase family protein [Clostridia bacterium]
MRKSFGAKTWAYPMPVFIIAAYDEKGNVNAMNAAWGGITEENQISICISADHKTTQNIQVSGAFTVSMATADTVTACDYLGVISGNDEPNKMEKAGFHSTRSELVNAPVIDELPMALECRLISYDPETCLLVGEIVNISADASVLDEKGKISAEKLKPITYDAIHNTYRVLGDVVGYAFKDGFKLQ